MIEAADETLNLIFLNENSSPSLNMRFHFLYARTNSTRRPGVDVIKLIKAVITYRPMMAEKCLQNEFHFCVEKMKIHFKSELCNLAKNYHTSQFRAKLVAVNDLCKKTST